tara:strand:+ start:285 stop:713 length:429 start_codon:yes stop_codon:yes gene_type:complete
MKKSIYTLALLLIGAITIMGFSNKPIEYSSKKTYYVYVTAWSNGLGTDVELPDDGHAYVTNVFTYRAYSGLNKSSIKIQFSDEFKSRKGRDKHYAFITKGNVDVWAYNSYDEAAKKRRASMSKYADKGSVVKQMNHFEYFSK